MIEAVYKHYLDPLTKHFQKGIKELVMNSPSEVLLEDVKGVWTKRTDKDLNKKWAKEGRTANQVKKRREKDKRNDINRN